MPVSFNGSYSQNFDTLANTGTNVTWTNDTTLPGWFLFRQPSPGTALTTYFTDNGSDNTGNFYSYGTTGITERALGGLGSGGAYFGNPTGDAIAGWIAFAATNNTGTTITSFSISFNGEQWRAANTTPQTMVLEYAFGSNFTSIPSNSWTPPGGNFNWTSPVNNNSVTVDGNVAGRVSGRGGSINTNWANGETLWIRWLEVNDAGFDHGLAIDDFSLTIPTVSLTPASITQNEGNSGTTDYTFTATLSRAVTQNVTVNYSTNDGTATLANNDYIDNDNSIIFTAGGSLTQTITVQVKGDAIVETNETFTIRLNSATNAQIDTTVNQVTGTINNDDTAGVTIAQSGGSTNITEGSATDTYDIVLTSQPTADVTIAINNGTQTGTSPTSLTFTSANWNVAQTVTVTATNDNIAEGNHTATISHTTTSSDANYNSIAINSVTANITDNDIANVVVSSISSNTTETGGNANFTVILNSQPTSDVTVNFASSNSQEGMVPANITFNATNWNQAQTVTVTGVDDNIDDGNITYNIQTSVVSNDPSYGAIAPNQVTIINIDNDTAGFTITPTSLSTNEIGTQANFTVKLDTQPTADVTINLSSSNPAEGTIDKSSLTFTAGNWNAAQTVTITGKDDFIADGDKAYQIITSAATSTDTKYNNLNPVDINVTNTDNETAGFTITPTTLTTGENGTTASFTVRMNTQPSADVTLNLTSSNLAEGTIDKSSLTFNDGNWNAAQTVTITRKDDFIADGDQTYQIITAAAISTDNKYNNLNPIDVNVTNTDNDTPGFTITPTTLTTGENGTTANFTVKLNSQPTADVILGLNTSNSAEGIIDKSSLTFTVANWNAPQTVTIAGKDDNIIDGDKAYQIITATATSADSNYNNLNPADINVTNTDNDTPGFTITPTTLTTGENGTTANFTVKLNTQPTADVTLNLISSNPAEGTIDKSALTFTTGNWNTAQTVTITGKDDNIVDGDKAYQIITAAATSTDSNYNNLNPVDINVTNTDNDNVNVSITPSAIAKPELNIGVTAYTFNVNLSNPSNVPVTVTYTTDNGSAIAFTDYIDNDGTIVFNPGETSKSITVNVIGDTNLEADETFAVNLTSATNATLNTILKQSTGLIINDDLEECFCKQIVYPNLERVIPEAEAKRSQIDGTANNDILIGGDISEEINSFDGDDWLFSSAGEDNLYCNIGNDIAFGGSDRDFILGDKGNDFLSSNAGNDIVNGNQGNDTIRGGQGNDFLRGGQNNDLIWGDKGDDTLAGDKGNDTVFGDNGEWVGGDIQGRDLLFGGSGDDILNGNQGNDTLFGEDGNDTVRGGKDDDIVVGNAGDDLLFGDLGNDSLCGAAGNDTIFGGHGSQISVGANGEKDCLCGGEGNDLLFGNEGQDKLNGEEGNDTLMGGKDNDTMIGGADNDRLIGDLGNDLLTGGTGNDRFVLLPGKDTDTIGDFEDGIDLLEIGGNLSFVQLSIIQSNNATLINVTQTGELLAILNGVQANLITQQDFVQ